MRSPVVIPNEIEDGLSSSNLDARIIAVASVWSTGCTVADDHKPWECEECNAAMVAAMKRAFEECLRGKEVDERLSMQIDIYGTRMILTRATGNSNDQYTFEEVDGRKPLV